jgi:hypothetical protein
MTDTGRMLGIFTRLRAGSMKGTLEVLSSLENLTQLLNQRLTEIGQALANQSELINQRLSETVQGLDHQSQNFSTTLKKVIDGIDGQSALLDRKLNGILLALRELASSSSQSDERLECQASSSPERLVNHSDTPRAQPNDDRPSPGTIEAIDARGNPLVGPNRIFINDNEFEADDTLKSADENQLEKFQFIFDSILAPPEVEAPPGYFVDFMGILTDSRFLTAAEHDQSMAGGGSRRISIPTLQDNFNADSEWWFETVDWFIAALEAREKFVMISLGASYGAQPVGAYKALMMVNPLPSKLVAVEADPHSCSWIRQHFKVNNIDPNDHWILQAAVSDTDEPVLFPVGASGLGSNNCVSTNEPKARSIWIDTIKRNGDPTTALENLIRYGSTGLMHDIGAGFSGEVKFVSAVTVMDVLSPFEKIDLLECDIQQSEIVSLPPYLDLLRRKVKRIHIGTHGAGVHRALYHMFSKAGWQVVFNYKPNSTNESPWGRFSVNDGILTLQNPDLR